MRIDHVIYVAEDRDAAAARLAEQLGVPVLEGGRHEGLGTHNRILPLGGGYLEVLAIADEAEAGAGPLGQVVRGRLQHRGEGLHGWVVAVDDVRPVAQRLGTTITEIAREGLTAHLTGLAESLADPSLPFFIARDAGVPDPGADGDGGGIAWVEVAGDRGRLGDWLGGAELPVRVVDGPPGVVALGLGSGAELR